VKVQPISDVRQTSNRLFKISDGEEAWLLKRYCGKNSRSHRDTEENRLLLWGKAGFHVPKVINLELDNEEEPYLVLEWLEGQSLAEYLRLGNTSSLGKLERISGIIIQFYKRHLFVAKEQDPFFIHHDPNSGNIFLTEDTAYYIDFEESIDPKSRPLTEMMAIELAKFLRWATTDIGKEYLPDIIQMTIKVYGRDNEILRLLIESVYRRPVQFVHRYRDYSKKIKMPDEITKYDIADGFSRELSR